jgi:hypothetical protein
VLRLGSWEVLRLIWKREALRLSELNIGAASYSARMWMTASMAWVHASSNVAPGTRNVWSGSSTRGASNALMFTPFASITAVVEVNLILGPSPLDTLRKERPKLHRELSEDIANLYY